jgi:hypothetical protein
VSGSKQVIANMMKWAVEKKIACEAVSAVTAANMQNHARINKKWQDITGNAKAGLHGGYFWENTQILKLYIAHSMEYGIWLELANDSKYAILDPTIKEYQDKWFKSIGRIMTK